MRTQKRLWIYSGLAVPAGVGLVRLPPLPRVTESRRVLLVGGRAAESLLLPMASLAEASVASLHVDIDRGATTRDWAKGGKLTSHLTVFQPDVVFLALDPSDMLARRCIRARVRAARAREFWLVPPGISTPPRTRFITAAASNAAGYAAWAARAWTMVK